MKTYFFWLICFILVQLLSHAKTGLPQKPTNISCKIIDFVKMICTWDRLHSSHRTEWILWYGTHCNGNCLFSKHWNLRRHKRKMVIWDENSVSAFSLYCKKCIQIIGESKTGIIKSNLMKFVPEYIVELSPVKITEIQTTDASIYITWQHPLLERETVCSVRYASGHHPFHYQMKWNKSNNIHLTELSPSTRYTIWIHWKLNDSIFWSKEKGLNVTTNHASLKAGPVIIEESYLKHRCLWSNETCASIYWKPIQGSLARTTFYEISYCAPWENIYRNITRVDAERCYLEMKYPYFPFKFICIRANTEIGFSPYSTFILNQKSSASPKIKKVTVKETKDRQTLLVTWSYESAEMNPQMSPGTNLTLLWCQGRKMFTDVLVVSCEDQVDWITVIANGSYLLRLSKAIDINRFHVAVILNTKTGVQKMIWSECIFTQTRYVNDLSMSLFTTNLHDKIFVQWYPIGCKITTIPLMYQVAYTRKTTKYQQNPCESGSIVNVSISQTNVELKNIEGDELYYICIRIMTVSGPTVFTKPHLVNSTSASTKERTSTQQFLPYLCILIGIILCILIQYYRHLKKISIFTKFKIQFPEIITDDERENEKK